MGAAQPYDPARVQAHVSDRIKHEERGFSSPCWIWQSGINNGGYATGRPSGCAHGLMHRISYEAFVGPIPEGLSLDHLCRVRCCVNPAHLEPVTQTENMRRSLNWKDGRSLGRVRDRRVAARNERAGELRLSGQRPTLASDIAHRKEGL